MTTAVCVALRSTARSATLALAAMLAACGGGGSSSDTAIEYDNHLPLQVGDRRVYREQFSAGSFGNLTAISTETVHEARQVDGTLYYFVASTGGTSIFPSLYAASASGIRARAPNSADSVESSDLVRFPTHKGASFVGDWGYSYDQDYDGKPDPYSVRVTTTTVGVETVSTVAGEFSGALHMREQSVGTLRMSSTGIERTTTDTKDTWYVPGVGRVRWESRGGGYFDVGELMRHVPAGRPDPDKAPPVLLHAGPPPGTTLHAGQPLVLTFSEPVTTSTLNAVTVASSAGSYGPLPRVGPYDADGRSVNLYPSYGWSEGTYTIRVAEGIEDLAGNRMAAMPDSSFTVSGDFALINSNVPRFAVGVRADVLVLSASLNMEIDPLTLSAVKLRENGTVVPATVSAMLVRGLQVTPSAPLKPLTRYTVDLTGLTSDTGLPVVGPQDWTFTTDAASNGNGIAAPTLRASGR